MPIVLIKCPKSGRHFATGLEISTEGNDFLDSVRQSALCPYCKKEHRWTKQDAILVPSDRWSEIPEVQECYLRAIESAEKASKATKSADRDFHSRMERKWLGLAEGYEVIVQVERR
jgi:hypothetical protein